jgi:hypothetical protein
MLGLFLCLAQIALVFAGDISHGPASKNVMGQATLSDVDRARMVNQLSISILDPDRYISNAEFDLIWNSQTTESVRIMSSKNSKPPMKRLSRQ